MITKSGRKAVNNHGQFDLRSRDRGNLPLVSARPFASDIFSEAARSLGLRTRNWSHGDDVMFAVYADGDSFIGTLRATAAGLVGEGFSASGRDTLRRFIGEYDRFIASSPGPSSAVSP